MVERISKAPCGKPTTRTVTPSATSSGDSAYGNNASVWGVGIKQTEKGGRLSGLPCLDSSSVP